MTQTQRFVPEKREDDRPDKPYVIIDTETNEPRQTLDGRVMRVARLTSARRVADVLNSTTREQREYPSEALRKRFETAGNHSVWSALLSIPEDWTDEQETDLHARLVEVVSSSGADWGGAGAMRFPTGRQAIYGYSYLTTLSYDLMEAEEA